MLALSAVETGALDLDSPAASVWTEFGAHVNTQGFLVGELLRRATGIPVAYLLRERLAGPLGVELSFGLPATEHKRVSRVFVPDVRLEEADWPRAFPPTGDAIHDRMVWHTYFNPLGLSGFGTVNTPAWREAVIPSTNGHGNARAVAALYAAYLRGGGALPALAWASSCPRRAAHSAPRRAPTATSATAALSASAIPTPNSPSPGNLNRPGARWQTPRTQRLLGAVCAAL